MDTAPDEKLSRDMHNQKLAQKFIEQRGGRLTARDWLRLVHFVGPDGTFPPAVRDNQVTFTDLPASAPSEPEPRHGFDRPFKDVPRIPGAAKGL